MRPHRPFRDRRRGHTSGGPRSNCWQRRPRSGSGGAGTRTRPCPQHRCLRRNEAGLDTLQVHYHPHHHDHHQSVRGLHQPEPKRPPWAGRGQAPNNRYIEADDGVCSEAAANKLHQPASKRSRLHQTPGAPGLKPPADGAAAGTHTQLHGAGAAWDRPWPASTVRCARPRYVPACLHAILSAANGRAEPGEPGPSVVQPPRVQVMCPRTHVDLHVHLFMGTHLLF
mmetsp:Transcript_1363/g.2585  ORF Transcript_1363/g.2585 Transcript_1363/m.2585 type:complete len:225 (+) Transcript_1363:609-1283(+)